MKKLNNYLQSIHTLKALSEYDFSEYSKGDPVIYNNMLSGYINHFSKTLELAWKLQKSILEYEGVSEAETGSQKQIIRLSYKYGLIANSEKWLVALDDRNLSTHIYDEKGISEAYNKIKSEYVDLIDSFTNNAIDRVIDLMNNNDLPLDEIDDGLKTLHNLREMNNGQDGSISKDNDTSKLADSNNKKV